MNTLITINATGLSCAEWISPHRKCTNRYTSYYFKRTESCIWIWKYGKCSRTMPMNKLMLQREWKISSSHSRRWEQAWGHERYFVSSCYISWSSKEIFLERIKKMYSVVSKLWAGFWIAVKGKIRLDYHRDIWQGTFADSDWSSQWEWHQGVFTCSVNLDVKQARGDIKDMKGVWELLPQVRFWTQ